MKIVFSWIAVSMVCLTVNHSSTWAAETVTLENAENPGANLSEEPLAEKFSLPKATQFLDSASLHWQKSRKCFTCHTNYSYLMARPAISQDSVALKEVRSALEKQVRQRWPEKGPRWDAEVIMSATVLAFNDAHTSGKLHDTTRTALARMWTLQRADGGFDWLKCDWPPMESDDHYGVTMALIGVGVAPDGYAKTPAAVEGLKKLRQYLQANPAPMLHHRAMELWAATYVDGVMSQDERKEVIKQLFLLQRPDGGWSLASLGDWKRADNKEQDKRTSDGYGTGFVVYVLRRAGVATDDVRIQRGVQWLKTHQRISGRWFTRSLHKDSRHYITHAGTAFAILALDACGEISSQP